MKYDILEEIVRAIFGCEGGTVPMYFMFFSSACMHACSFIFSFSMLPFVLTLIFEEESDGNVLHLNEV